MWGLCSSMTILRTLHMKPHTTQKQTHAEVPRATKSFVMTLS